MPTDCITYQESGYFTPLIVDYLNQKPEVQPFYHRFPTLDNFAAQMAEKQATFSLENRAVLVAALQKQYDGVKTSKATAGHITLLGKENAFTVTTGHQLNLFTGPLYFLYKIISTINLCKELGAAYPDKHFVPVYWMATEDHDFDEINFFKFKGRKFQWNRDHAGAVGRLSTEGLDAVLEVFGRELGPGKNADALRALFSEAYLKHQNLAEATRYLANSLFGEYGLVILDADRPELKALFVPYIRRELLEQVSYQRVSDTIKALGHYTIQVNPREINLFYLEDKLRERIIEEKGRFKVNNTALEFSEEEILALAERHPERFSPNVITRPLYQEVILPNLCYIGGGGEIAYWLELKAFFEAVDVTFPVLLVRNSVLLATEKQAGKADKLGLTWADLFTNRNVLANKKVREFSAFPIDLTPMKQALQAQFETLQALAQQTDKSFTGAVLAQQSKQTKGLENLEKRLLKAQKRKHAEILSRIRELQEELFPGGGLQERSANFSEFYLQDREFVSGLFGILEPLSNQFTIYKST